MIVNEKNIVANKSAPRKTLYGMIPPLVTPLQDIDTLDNHGMERLIEHVIQGGVHGIFILGTTGEAPGLSYRLRKELIKKVCVQVRQRVPVLVGITDTSIVESIHLANVAADCGAGAVVAAPPYYFTADQQELIRYYKKIASQIPLPLYIYNLPAFTKTFIEGATVREMAEHKNIAGIKDSSGNMPHFRLLQYALKDVPEFEIFAGLEEILSESILLGANGGVNGGANMFPELYVGLYEASVAKDFEKIRLLNDKVFAICSTIYKVDRSPSSYLRGLKCALSLMGLCNDFMADPYYSFQDKEREKIKKMLMALDMNIVIKE